MGKKHRKAHHESPARDSAPTGPGAAVGPSAKPASAEAPPVAPSPSPTGPTSGGDPQVAGAGSSPPPAAGGPIAGGSVAAAPVPPRPETGATPGAAVAPDAQASPPDSLAGCVCRVTWLLFAPGFLGILGLLIAVEQVSLGSLLDVGYAFFVAVILVARRIDERSCRAQQELPFTGNSRRFALGFLALALLGWVAAHGIGGLTR